MRPYGYEDDRLTVRTEEADALREAADRILNGASLRSTAVWLNDSGHRTSAGGPWHPNTVRRVLTNPRVAGMVELEDSLDTADWEPIIDPRDWEKLTNLLTDPARRSASVGSARVYLLTGGLARCGLCDSPLVARPDRSGARGYICRSGPPTQGCGRIRVHGDALEEHVGVKTLARLADPAVRERLLALGSAAASDAAERVRDLQQKARDLADDYADGKIARFSFAQSSKSITDRIAAAREAGRRADEVYLLAPLSTPHALASWWNDATPQERRALTRLVVDHVDVHPVRVRGARTFDPDRVVVHWHSDVDHAE